MGLQLSILVRLDGVLLSCYNSPLHLAAPKSVTSSPGSPGIGQRATSTTSSTLASGLFCVPHSRTISSLKKPRSGNNPAKPRGCGDEVWSISKLGKESAQEIVQVSGDQSDHLQIASLDASSDEQAESNHGQRHHLRGDGEEEEAMARAARVLACRVAEGKFETAQKKSVERDVVVEDLDTNS